MDNSSFDKDINLELLNAYKKLELKKIKLEIFKLLALDLESEIKEGEEEIKNIKANISNSPTSNYIAPKYGVDFEEILVQSKILEEDFYPKLEANIKEVYKLRDKLNDALNDNLKEIIYNPSPRDIKIAQEILKEIESKNKI